MVDTPGFEVPPQMRDLAETNILQARKAFDGFMGVAKRGAETARGSADLSRSSVQDMIARGFDTMEANVHAGFAVAQRLTRAGSPQEFMQIQAEYVRERFAAMQEQARAFGGLAQDAFKEGAARTRAAMEQGAGEARRMTEQGQASVEETARAARDAAERSTP